MKRVLITLSVLLAIACEKTEEKNVMTVEGNIDGLKVGTIYLQKYVNDKLTNIDSIVANGSGKFSFKQPLESPEVFYLYLDLNKQAGTDLGDRLMFFGEPKTISINSSYDMLEVKAKVSGSESQKQYGEYLHTMRQFGLRNAELLEKQVNAMKSGNVALADSLNSVSEKNNLRRHLFVLNYALTHPDSYITPYVVLVDAPNTRVKYLDSIYGKLTPAVAESKYGKEFKSYIARARKAEKQREVREQENN
ncbi:MAG: DUF4369 domain-containing protein [Capnocytophaga sp.]|jgi:hypothetical protein|uniref:DUF4369 domain-containing protein n=1 Tax=Capnocytophaga sp. TaxID=44737 RepID=UPI0028EAE486|nr:DUF4369 domain-containing protein [uncultured Capnocytophaga sp.]